MPLLDWGVRAFYLGVNIKRNCHGKCILDGELIVPVGGKPDFYELQKRTLATTPFKIQLAVSRYPAAFVAYDILYADGKQLAELPLMEAGAYCLHY